MNRHLKIAEFLEAIVHLEHYKSEEYFEKFSKLNKIIVRKNLNSTLNFLKEEPSYFMDNYLKGVINNFKKFFQKSETFFNYAEIQLFANECSTLVHLACTQPMV